MKRNIHKGCNVNELSYIGRCGETDLEYFVCWSCRKKVIVYTEGQLLKCITLEQVTEVFNKMKIEKTIQDKFMMEFNTIDYWRTED